MKMLWTPIIVGVGIACRFHLAIGRGLQLFLCLLRGDLSYVQFYMRAAVLEEAQYPRPNPRLWKCWGVPEGSAYRKQENCC